MLVVVVDANGEVTDVAVREGGTPFSEAAMAGVRTWRFAPATRDDTAVPSRIVARVKFLAPDAPPRVPPSAPIAPSPPPIPRAPTTEPEEVDVRGEREEPSTIHIPRTESRLVAGAFGDPFKVLEALPGTSPWLSGLPYYFVRGAPPETVGYFIDGIRVPLLFHVGPGPSTLAPALVDSVDLFPAAYPARYGRYSGAIVAGETTPPRTDRAHGEFSARIYDASAFAETPFDRGAGTVMAAARYAYTGPLISLIVPDYSLDYWDYQLRASHELGAGALSIFAFGAHDELHYRGQPTFRIEYHRVDVRYDRPIAGGSVRAAFTLNYDDSLATVQSDTGGGDRAAQTGPGWRLRVEADQRISAHAKVRMGADASETMFTTDDYPVVEGVRPPVGPHTNVEGGAYADVVWRPVRAVELVPGARLDGYVARSESTWAPQPRLAARIGLAPSVTWVSSMGTAHQEPTEAIFVPGKVPYPVSQSSQSSYQFAEGIEAQLPSSMRARVSGYYARLVAEHVLGTDATELGQSVGLEVFVHRDFTRRLGGFVSYTLGRTTGTAGGVTRRVAWDRTHVVSVVAGYDLGHGWRAGGRLFFESGRPSPPACVTNCGTSAGTTSTFYDPGGDLPPFWRLDARIEKRWELAGGQWLAATLECFNAFGEAEAVGDRYSPANGVSVTYQSPIILPTIGAEGGF
ncbi:MAG: energy transducer TonB [Thermoplasmata archaeon]|nr:energy transducer TonB [Thermoplasmata archaeon]